MNKLREPIEGINEGISEKLCFNGVDLASQRYAAVEWKTLGEVVSIEKGEQLNKDGLLDEGPVPVINGGINPSGYWHTANFDANSITISQGGASAGYVNWLGTPFWAGAHCYVLTKPKTCVNYRYIYHFAKWKQTELMSSQVGAGIPSVSSKKIASLPIPVPPLEVQCEIVQILDNFANLKAELEAELAARIKQYQHYRDTLFESDAPQSTIEETLVSLKTGLNPRQNFKLNTPKSVCPYVTGKDVYGNKINISERTDLIEPEVVSLINRRACIETDDVMFASTGTGTVGRMAIVEDYHNDWAVSETMYCMKTRKDKILPKYLMFALTSARAKNQYEPKISKGSVPHLKVVDLMRVKIPLPPLAEQERIVGILDKFDKLVNSLTEGLPAEISARQKQYEYYRDKLLSFGKEAK